MINDNRAKNISTYMTTRTVKNKLPFAIDGQYKQQISIIIAENMKTGTRK